MSWYSGNVVERQTFLFRAFGHYVRYVLVDVLLQRHRALIVLLQKKSGPPP